MFKIMIKISLALTALCLYSSVFSENYKTSQYLSIDDMGHQLLVKTANPKYMSTQECSDIVKNQNRAGLNKKISISPKHEAVNLSDKLKLKGFSCTSFKENGGVISRSCHAVAYYTDPSGVVHTHKFISQEVGVVDGEYFFGAFNDGFCQGFVRGTFVS